MFEWDDTKSERNLRDRGFDFAFAARIFEGDVLEHEDRRADYRERRTVAVGEIEEDVFVVVYTSRGDARRIISARRANKKERHAYRQAFGRASPQDREG
ncbi:MAG: BrnT family toxin [Dongiaceae bacterium]